MWNWLMNIGSAGWAAIAACVSAIVAIISGRTARKSSKVAESQLELAKNQALVANLAFASALKLNSEVLIKCVRFQWAREENGLATEVDSLGTYESANSPKIRMIIKGQVLSRADEILMGTFRATGKLTLSGPKGSSHLGSFSLAPKGSIDFRIERDWSLDALFRVCLLHSPGCFDYGDDFKSLKPTLGDKIHLAISTPGWLRRVRIYGFDSIWNDQKADDCIAKIVLENRASIRVPVVWSLHLLKPPLVEIEPGILRKWGLDHRSYGEWLGGPSVDDVVLWRAEIDRSFVQSNGHGVVRLPGRL